jgi:hypothetical protein
MALPATAAAEGGLGGGGDVSEPPPHAANAASDAVKLSRASHLVQLIDFIGDILYGRTRPPCSKYDCKCYRELFVFAIRIVLILGTFSGTLVCRANICYFRWLCHALDRR